MFVRLNHTFAPDISRIVAALRTMAAVLAMMRWALFQSPVSIVSRMAGKKAES